MVTEVEITALGPVRKSLGYNNRTVEIEGNTVRDLLREVQTRQDGSLYDFMVGDDGELESDLVVFLNEKQIKPEELDRSLSEGDKVVTMQVIRPIRGGAAVRREDKKNGTGRCAG